MTSNRIRVEVQLGDKRYWADLSRPVSLAIPQHFDQHQVNHFGVEPARRAPIRAGDFIGSTRQGGSCNVDRISITPHCNGTHVEHVGHIVDEVSGGPLKSVAPLMIAALISVETAGAERCGGETYRPPLNPGDRMVSAASLRKAAANLPDVAAASALIIRTLPNDAEKRHRRYGPAFDPPFFTVEALAWINDVRFEHLLVDFPSLDRMHDEGLLTNHHLFWNIAETTHRVAPAARIGRSVSELLFVPDELPDGFYLLNLQFPDWGTDAAPARPIVFPLKAHDDHDQRID